MLEVHLLYELILLNKPESQPTQDARGESECYYALMRGAGNGHAYPSGIYHMHA